MNHLASFTSIAAQATERYLEVTGVFRSLLSAAMLDPFTNARALALRDQALDVARAYLNVEFTLCSQTLLTVAQDAISAAHSDVSKKNDRRQLEGLEAFLEQSQSYLTTEIWVQLQRDVESTVKRYRDFALMTDLSFRSTQNSRREALVATLVNTNPRFRFKFHDRAGRVHLSQRFVKTLWRSTLVCLYVDFYILAATKLGFTRFVITNLKDTSVFQGHEIDLASDQADFLELRDEVFHPNSDAVLKVVL